jgi:hypothetical protein
MANLPISLASNSKNSSMFKLKTVLMHVLTRPAVIPGKNVAVAGAGLAGLAFGLSLLKQCHEQGVSPLPKITLFDRDASADAREGQGYFLNVRSDTGGLQASTLNQACDQLSGSASCYTI